jgi:2-C-methyl-D-erythritol 4-phosphate cytidylyltransferase
LVEHACRGLLKCREIDGLVLVVPRGRIAALRDELRPRLGSRLLSIVAGGASRNLSTRAGLADLPEQCRWVLVHDAARPFAPPRLVRRVLEAARRHGAAIPALPVHDSIVELESDSTLRRYLPRERLRAVQTPQGFAREVLEEAFRRSRKTHDTDDASLVRRLGHRVAVVDGEFDNQKLTTAAEVRQALQRLGDKP